MSASAELRRSGSQEPSIPASSFRLTLGSECLSIKTFWVDSSKMIFERVRAKHANEGDPEINYTHLSRLT